MSYKESINMQGTQHAHLIQYLRDSAWSHHRLGFIWWSRLLQKLLICHYEPICIIRLTLWRRNFLSNF